MLPHKTKILYCVLNWGLGHASRSIQLIEQLLANKNELKIASDGNALTHLKNKFPNLPFIELPKYSIKYGKGKYQVPLLFIQIPKILRAIKQEHQFIHSLVLKDNYQWIISDNRYGCYHKNVYSVFIGHQLSLISPIFYHLIQKLHSNWINRFNEIWVPDHPEKKLIPKLAENPNINKRIQYLGWISQFYKYPKPKTNLQKYQYLAIISGPEPQRTLLEKKIIHLAQNHPQFKFCIIGGNFSTTLPKTISNLEYHPYLSGLTLWEVLHQTEKIICRSGYSSVMDNLLAGFEAIYVPTPGQTEQLYIAQQLQQHFQATIWQQKDIHKIKL